MWVRFGEQTAPMPASAARDCYGTTPPTATAASAAPFATDKRNLMTSAVWLLKPLYKSWVVIAD